MSENGIPEFEEILSQINKDLEELESVSSNLKSIQEHTANIKEFGNRYKESIELIQGKIADLIGRIDKSIQDSEELMKTVLKDINDEADKLSATIGFFEDKLSEIADRLSKELDRMAEIDFPSFFQGVNDTLISVKKDSQNASKYSENIQKIVDDLKSQTADMNSKLDKYDTRLKDIEKTMTLLQPDFDNKVQNLSRDMRDMSKDLSSDFSSKFEEQKRDIENKSTNHDNKIGLLQNFSIIQSILILLLIIYLIFVK